MLYFLIILFNVFSCQNILSQESHLWEQLAPRLTSSSVQNNHSYDEMLKLCAANALTNHGQTINRLDSETLQTLESLHMFSNVIPKLATTNLYHGYFAFAKNCCSISHDLTILQRQQEIITYLQQHPELIEQLNFHLSFIKKAETAFLWNFFPNGQDVDSIAYNGSFAKLVELYNLIKKTIESNRFLSEKWQRAKQFAVITTCIGVGTMAYHFNQICERERAYHHDNLAMFNSSLANLTNVSGMPTALGLSTMIIALAQTINLSVITKQDFDDVFRKQKTLMRMRQLINATKEINLLLQQHPTLLKLLPEAKTITEFAQYNDAANVTDAKMQHFLQLLYSSTFTGKPTYFISFQGKIIQTYGLFNEVKNNFVVLWEALGNIDSHLCVQKLLQSTSQQFCQPIWLDQQQPALQLINYWHPMISYQNAVLNCLTLGHCALENQPQNIVITGANAGGKTTALTAILIAQILAQSIGIAPAQSLTATPFAKIHTYLDITTNLTANESLFMAQANRAEKLYKSITSCCSSEKALTILDEIFTGTRADFAQQASYDFANKLGSLPHSICLLTTHFPMLTELEKTQNFMNYHAANAQINNDGSLTYPYKITPGISTQNIAEHILKHKGLIQ